MGRPRSFEEVAVVQASAELFAQRAYDGVSVDDLVDHVGVHRNSLYQTFGSKRGLYLAALRWTLEHRVRPLIAQLAGACDLRAGLRAAGAEPAPSDGLGLLLLAAAERASEDPEVAGEIADILGEIDRAAWRTRAGGQGHGQCPPASCPLAVAFTALLLGLALRARASALPIDPAQVASALATRLD